MSEVAPMHHGEDARVSHGLARRGMSEKQSVGRVTPSESRRGVRTWGYLKLCAGPLAPSRATTNDQCCLVCRRVRSDTVIRVYIRTFQCLFSFIFSTKHITLKWLTVVWKGIFLSSLVTFQSSIPNSPALGRGLTPKWGRWKKKWANSDRNSWTEKATTSSKAQLGIYFYFLTLIITISFNLTST